MPKHSISRPLTGLLGLCAALAAGSALAQPRTYTLPEETAQLRPAEGRGFEATQANCLSCHSPDYIAMQPPRKGPAFWAAEVTKMIKIYHAPIDEAEGKAIAAYLADAY